MSTFLSKPKNTILHRCQNDESTRARLKYQPWYHHIERQQGSRIWIDGRELLMMTSNDYLGLSENPKVIEAGQRALKDWGTSTTGARPANGSRTIHSRLEQKLAAFLGKEACQITAAGYLSCMAAVATFATKGDLILVDRNVHSSLWSGIMLSGARTERFAHNNPTDLREALGHEDKALPKLLILEGIYSMEGHIARLPELIKETQGHNCFTIMDDAHGFGVLGKNGEGTAAHFGMTADVDIICGSFSKSLSSTGGFIAASSALIEYLRTHSKQTIFSAAISPSQAACAEAALDILQSDPTIRTRLWDNTTYYKKILTDLGIDYWGSESPAVPIVIGETERAYRVWKKLYDLGIFTILAIAPGVPPGKDLLRTAVSARHTHEELDRVGEALAKTLKKS
ncbi:MAG: pyridoxal phosphate-dependent aminotransferase family protein [Verrucomicrobiota bacterium]|nr:pyridoxal phosphate-dependent aminotransferase family protein [Verrucomicrobiota bacterium]